MIYLFLDTSQQGEYFIAIVVRRKVYRFLFSEKDPAAFLPNFMLRSVESVGLEIDDIDRFYVFLGIGSYQGLKNGLAFLRGICHKRQNLYGVTIFDFFDKEDLVLLKSWKAGEYVYSYGGESYMESDGYDRIVSGMNYRNLITDDDQIVHGKHIDILFYRNDDYMLNLNAYYNGARLEPLYAHSFGCYLLRV